MITIDQIAEARRNINNQIMRTQEVIASYVENKLDELEETISEILTDLAEEA